MSFWLAEAREDTPIRWPLAILLPSSSGLSFSMTQPVASVALRRRAIGLALAFFLWAAVLLAVVKLLLAQAVGSLSLLACALHSLLLCFSAVLGLQALGAPGGARTPPRSQKSSRAAINWDRGTTGLLTTLTSLLMWALLGFGGFSLISEMWRRGAAGWISEVSQGLMWLEGGEAVGGGAIAPLDVPVGLNAAVLHPALLPLLGILAVLGFGLAFVSRLCARRLSNRTLAFQSYLLLQDGWLLLIAGVALVALGQGVTVLESVGALGILAMVLVDAWRWLGVHMPHWCQGTAIAPEAITATAQQVDGVIGCRVLACQGLVGRRLEIVLELRLHPEFESLRHRLSREVCRNLDRRYGPAQIEIYLVSKPGGPRRRLNLALEDEVSWVDGTDDSAGDRF